jgi:OHCU decarboxylase
MADARPFASPEAMAGVADSVFDTLGPEDWLEAFAAHPKIGAASEGGAGPAPRSAKASAERCPDDAWSEQEQASVVDAAEATLVSLAAANRDYEARFGYIFIVCATGKSASEMLGLLERRMANAPEFELRVAATEQRKITRLRLMKLVEGSRISPDDYDTHPRHRAR